MTNNRNTQEEISFEYTLKADSIVKLKIVYYQCQISSLAVINPPRGTEQSEAALYPPTQAESSTNASG